MSETTETAKVRAKKSTWQDTAISAGGRFMELALTGLILGITGAAGHKLLNGSSTSTQAKPRQQEDAAVTPLRKVGSA
ncbi:hypothetical protein WDW37_08090 [Bdellovibrionota bacterium FG-1]